MAPPPAKRLGELLVEAGVIDDHQLRAALGHQRQWGGKLGQALVDLKLAEEPQIVDALSKKLGYPVVNLAALDRDALAEALALLPREAARRHNVLPITADAKTLTLAMSDPTNVRVVDEVSFRTGRRVRLVLAGDREVARAVDALYFPEEARESRALEMTRSSSAPLNRSYDDLPDHAQQHYFRTTMRDIESGTPAPVPAAQPPAVPPAAAAPSPAAPPAPSPDPASRAALPPATREAALRDAIDRMALAGDEAQGGSLRGARLAAALARALLRRGLVTEAELLAELTQAKR